MHTGRYLLKPLLILASLALFFLLPNKDALAQNVSPKRVEIDISNQRLYAFDGSQKIFDFVVSTGKPWWPTPTGTFYPWIKLQSTRMIGGSTQYGTYYNLPNVPYVVYFYQGYGLHGTYWHNNFGFPMSHGCVNLKTADAEKIYNWIDMTTPITIYGTTPPV